MRRGEAGPRRPANPPPSRLPAAPPQHGLGGASSPPALLAPWGVGGFARSRGGAGRARPGCYGGDMHLVGPQVGLRAQRWREPSNKGAANKRRREQRLRGVRFIPCALNSNLLTASRRGGLRELIISDFSLLPARPSVSFTSVLYRPAKQYHTGWAVCYPLFTTVSALCCSFFAKCDSA